jgi:glycerol kinase
MQKDARITLSELRVDGGAAVNDLLMQFQADVLGVPVVRPRMLETTALGAAYLAGLAVGYWENVDKIAANRHVDRAFDPSMSRDRVAELRAGWQNAVSRAKGWASAG